MGHESDESWLYLWITIWLYGLPDVSHSYAYGKAYLKMVIHKYVFPSEFMDFHMNFQANAYGNP